MDFNNHRDNFFKDQDHSLSLDLGQADRQTDE